MKKKIILALLIVSMLVCLFAISVSAEWIDGMDYTLNSNGTATFSAKNRTECTLTEMIIPEYVTDANGKTYKVTTLADRCIGHQDTGAGNQYVEYVYIPKTVTYLGAQLVRNCPNLRVVRVDASVTSIADGAFWNLPNLEELDLSGMTSLKTTARITSGSGKIKSIKFPSSLENLGAHSFQASSNVVNITELVLPNRLTSIGSNCFQYNNFSKVVIPASVTTIGGAAFHSVYDLKTVVFANSDISGYSTNVTFTSSPVSLIFYAGKNADTVKTQFSQFTKFNAVSYEDYLKNPSATYTNTIVYGTQNCIHCGDVITNLEYFKFTSFTEEMHDAYMCQNCGKVDSQDKIVNTYAPILTFSGYSAKIGGDEICVGYTINYDSLRIYEQKTGKQAGTVKFGITASVVANATAKYETLKNNFNTIGGAIVTQINNDCPAFDFILTDFTADYYNIPLVMCAFVSDGVDIYYADVGGCNTYATPITYSLLTNEE